MFNVPVWLPVAAAADLCPIFSDFVDPQIAAGY